MNLILDCKLQEKEQEAIVLITRGIVSLFCEGLENVDNIVCYTPADADRDIKECIEIVLYPKDYAEPCEVPTFKELQKLSDELTGIIDKASSKSAAIGALRLRSL